MEESIEHLKDILKNLKKSPNRTYTEKTIQNKLEDIERIKEEFQTTESIENDEEKLYALKSEFNNIYTKIKQYLLESPKELEHKSENNDNQIQNSMNMATQNFNLEVALKTIPEFTGNYRELKSFLTIIELIKTSLAADQETQLLKFVFNVKLSSTVRTALGTSAPTTFDDLKKCLTDRYKTTKTVAHIQATLSTFSQKNMNVHTYHEKLLNSIAELNELQKEEIHNCNTVQADTIKLINEKYALTIFKNGLNGELKPTIFASRPKDLNDAVHLALELEKDFARNSDQVLYFSNNRNGQNRNRLNRNVNQNTNRNNYQNNNSQNYSNANRNTSRPFANNFRSNNNNGRIVSYSRNTTRYNSSNRYNSNNRCNNNNNRNNSNNNCNHRNNNRYVHCVQEHSRNQGNSQIPEVTRGTI